MKSNVSLSLVLINATVCVEFSIPSLKLAVSIFTYPLFQTENRRSVTPFTKSCASVFTGMINAAAIIMTATGIATPLIFYFVRFFIQLSAPEPDYMLEVLNIHFY